MVSMVMTVIQWDGSYSHHAQRTGHGFGINEAHHEGK